MKKTLKILMAIILFAVVLTIATSVNAATTPAEYDDFSAAVAAQKNMGEADKEIDQKGTVYTVKKALKLKDLKAPSGITIVTDATNGTLEVTNEVKVTSGQKFIFSGAGKTFNGGVVVNEGGVLYTDTALTATVYGRVFTANGIAVTDTTGMTSVDLTLADAIIELPVKADDKKTEYTTVYVPESTVVGKDSLLTIDFKLTVPGTDTSVTKLEAGKKYNVEATVKYKELTLDPDGLTLEPYAGTEKEANTDETFTVTDGKTTITIPAKLKDGDVINLVATFENEEKEVALTVGAAPVDPDNKDDQNKPEQPEQPSKPDDDKKGDLDDAAAVATGDHIIPATALLAVVVVANVVYFAKSKRS